MSENTKTNGKPRHMGPTREVPLVGYTPRHDATNKVRPASPHLKADESKVNDWPVQDPNPTARFVTPPAPRPHIPPPNVVVEPAMTRQDALSMQKVCLYAAVVVAVFGVLAFVAQFVWGQ